ncbi:MAG: hypothetical protein ACI30W_01705 [Muribaculaceae bacterium]
MKNIATRLKSDWDAAAFFFGLAARNKLAREAGFVSHRVSGLQGFEDALQSLQRAPALLCVSDNDDGWCELDNTPRTRRVKTVFLAMRHAVDDMQRRDECIATMHELFRQLMSVLTLERVKLEQNCVYIDGKIAFKVIDRYFFSGCACAYFTIATDIYTDLTYDAAEWI